MNHWIRLALAGLALSSAVPAGAQTPAVDVQNVWTRATTPGAKTAALYMTLTSKLPDRLVSVTTPAAPRATVHETIKDGDIMKMRPVEGGLVLPAGKPVTLAPGGLHVMLEGLAAPLLPGQTVQVHLTFETSPPADVVAAVRGAGAASMHHSAMPGM